MFRKSQTLCEFVPKHFYAEDFEITSKRRKLKPGAWPRCHPNLPHLSKSAQETRPTTATSVEARLQAENLKILRLNDEILSAGSFTNFEELLSVLSDPNFILPSGFHVSKGTNHATFMYIINIEENPDLRASISFHRDLTFAAFVKRKQLPVSQFKHLLSSENRISSSTEISNVIAYVKSLCDSEASYSSESEPNVLNVTYSMLKNALENGQISGHEDLISFILNQLNLIQMNEHQRRYESNLLVLSFQWKMISTALYKRVSDLFILPSIRRLQQLSSGLNVIPSAVMRSTLL